MLKMAGNRILVEPLETETVSAGGIHLVTDEKKNQVRKGKVVAVGPGRTVDADYNAVKDVEQVTLPIYAEEVRYRMQVAEGDEILYVAYSGLAYKHEGKDYVIMTEAEILAFV